MWNFKESVLLRKLKKPHLVQQFVNDLTYNTDDFTRSVRCAIRASKAHCLDGALIAAAAFEYHSQPPLLMDLRANSRDDDHVLALYQRYGCWGAVAKSNFSGLRFREPIYRNLRELAASYFDDYFNLSGERTLREYSTPLQLRLIKKIDWRYGDAPVDDLSAPLDNRRHYLILNPKTERLLSRADKRSMLAGMVGMNKKGAFKS
jgi:hypothetical protein